MQPIRSRSTARDMCIASAGNIHPIRRQYAAGSQAPAEVYVHRAEVYVHRRPAGNMHRVLCVNAHMVAIYIGRSYNMCVG